VKVAELIAALQKQPQDAEVFIHDADTDWALPMHDEHPVRLGKNCHGEGKEGAVMLQSAGYY
jgi:hypothetical protein